MEKLSEQFKQFACPHLENEDGEIEIEHAKKHFEELIGKYKKGDDISEIPPEDRCACYHIYGSWKEMIKDNDVRIRYYGYLNGSLWNEALNDENEDIRKIAGFYKNLKQK